MKRKFNDDNLVAGYIAQGLSNVEIAAIVGWTRQGVYHARLRIERGYGQDDSLPALDMANFPALPADEDAWRAALDGKQYDEGEVDPGDGGRLVLPRIDSSAGLGASSMSGW